MRRMGSGLRGVTSGRIEPRLSRGCSPATLQTWRPSWGYFLLGGKSVQLPCATAAAMPLRR